MIKNLLGNYLLHSFVMRSTLIVALAKSNPACEEFSERKIFMQAG